MSLPAKSEGLLVARVADSPHARRVYTIKIILRLHRRVDLRRIVVCRHPGRLPIPLLQPRSRRAWEAHQRR